MLNVHATGGSKMIRESVDAVVRCAEKLKREQPIFLAVTVLTSLNDEDLMEIGFSKKRESWWCIWQKWRRMPVRQVW